MSKKEKKKESKKKDKIKKEVGTKKKEESKKKTQPTKEKESKKKDKINKEAESKKKEESKKKTQPIKKKVPKDKREGPGAIGKISALFTTVVFAIFTGGVSLYGLLKKDIPSTAAIVGILLILIATQQSGIVYIQEEISSERTVKVMWNGDMHFSNIDNPWSYSNIIGDEDLNARPFIINPITPEILLFFSAILVILGVSIRIFGIRSQKPQYDKISRGMIIFTIVLLWISIALIFDYFLNFHSDRTGIDFFSSYGIILVIIGFLTLLPMTSPYDFEAKSKKTG